MSATTLTPVRYAKPSYASEELGRIIDETNIPELTPSERRAVASEVSLCLRTLDRQLKEFALQDERRPESQDWFTKANFLKSQLSELLFLLRAYEKERAPTVLELKAKRAYMKASRRFKRQRLQIDYFLDLVETEIGPARVKEMLVESMERSLAAAKEWDEDRKLPEDPFDGTD